MNEVNSFVANELISHSNDITSLIKQIIWFFLFVQNNGNLLMLIDIVSNKKKTFGIQISVRILFYLIIKITNIHHDVLSLKESIQFLL